ncbi:MAG TPA: DNA double-strand break repair nuclease NurA [Ktedonobacterales bacterium]
MLYPAKLTEELQRQEAAFKAYSSHHVGQLAAWREALADLPRRYPSPAALRTALGHSGDEPHGALPTEDYARASGPGLAIPFGRDFTSHEEARTWAECLRGVTTLAVDGSQLLPWRDASLPVALVQAGLYENPHQPPAAYIKDVTTVVLTPAELSGMGESDMMDTRTGEVAAYSERVVHLRRFELEMATLVARIERHAGNPDALAFFDGSLIVSFARKLPPAYRDRYLSAARRLLDASARARVPVVGYIDTTYARDIVTMLRTLPPMPGHAPLPSAEGLYDALLWGGQLGWGDRTAAFLAVRDEPGMSGTSQPKEDREPGEVAFVYFQAALDRPPARLEIPRWVVDSGQLDRIVDLVRAECVVGNGYPYPIEAADAVAVISAHDRAQFYAIFQDFATRSGLPLTFSRKALSKSRRRV